MLVHKPKCGSRITLLRQRRSKVSELDAAWVRVPVRGESNATLRPHVVVGGYHDTGQVVVGAFLTPNDDACRPGSCGSSLPLRQTQTRIWSPEGVPSRWDFVPGPDVLGRQVRIKRSESKK